MPRLSCPSSNCISGMAWLAGAIKTISAASGLAFRVISNTVKAAKIARNMRSAPDKLQHPQGRRRDYQKYTLLSAAGRQRGRIGGEGPRANAKAGEICLQGACAKNWPGIHNRFADS